jgi:hypothetical protein
MISFLHQDAMEVNWSSRISHLATSFVLSILSSSRWHFDLNPCNEASSLQSSIVIISKVVRCWGSESMAMPPVWS